MAQEESSNSIERVLLRLKTFFHDTAYTEESVQEGLDSGDIILNISDFLPYLRTALLDETLLEVQFDSLTRLYFARIIDDIPDLEEVEEEGEVKLVEPEYNPGDYLQDMSHLITLPLEPGLGNLGIQYSKIVILRFFTSSYAVEFGTYYRQKTKVRELPVLRFAYPAIARIVRGAREYRAKVPNDMDLSARVFGKNNKLIVETNVANISAKGISFSLRKHEQELFKIDDDYRFELSLEGEVQVEIDGTVRHLSKARKQQTIEYLCGVQFDLATRELATKVELTMATVQRAYLKSLAELSEESGFQLIG